MSTKSLSSSLPKIKIPFPPIIDLTELLQPNKSFSLFDEPHKPSRAPNAFIIYRKMFVKVARKEGHNLPMTAISSMASIAWEKEPERVKAEYKRISKEAHLKKKAMFPKDKRKKRKETWNVVSFQGPNLLKHYEINHDDNEELDEDSNDISVIINSDTNTTTTIYNNNYNHKKNNNKNKNNDNNNNNNNNNNNIDNGSNNNVDNNNNNNNNNSNSSIDNNNIYSNYYNNFYSSHFGIPAPIYSPETVELNLQNYSNDNNSNNNNNNNNLIKEKIENRGSIFDSNFPLDIRNDENLDDLLDSFLYNQQHHQQNYHQNDNQIQPMSYTMLLQQPITTTVDHDNNISLHQYIQLHHTPDLSSDESISGISSPSLSLNDAETVSSNNNGFVYSDNNNIFNIYSNDDNNNNNDDDTIFLNIIPSDNNDNNKMFDTTDYHY